MYSRLTKVRDDLNYGLECKWTSKKERKRGAWMAQLVKRPTLDFGSGHDSAVVGIKPHIRLCTESVEPAWDSVSPSLPAPPLLMHASSFSLSLSINKHFLKRKKKENVCFTIYG